MFSNFLLDKVLMSVIHKELKPLQSKMIMTIIVITAIMFIRAIIMGTQ